MRSLLTPGVAVAALATIAVCAMVIGAILIALIQGWTLRAFVDKTVDGKLVIDLKIFGGFELKIPSLPTIFGNLRRLLSKPSKDDGVEEH
jgi:hypothetical protein